MNRNLTELIDLELDATRLIDDPEVDALLVGAVDLHVHPSPSPFPRRLSIADAAADAAGAGFRAIAVKSHHLSMQTDILALRESAALPDSLQVLAGIALNDSVGGLNPWAVDVVLSLGGRIVWFPTISSPAHIDHHRHHVSGFPTSEIPLRRNTEISILNEGGELRPEVYEILDLIVAHSAILNCGHLPARQIAALLPVAHERGVERIVISHPDFILGVSPSDLEEWGRYGAHVEHVVAMFSSPLADQDVRETLHRYRGVGIERTILSSDLGQRDMPLPVTSYRVVLRQLLDAGIPERDILAMVGGNAGALVDR